MLRLFRRKSKWPLLSDQGRVSLRPVKSPDLPIIESWFDDFELLQYAFGSQADESTLAKVARDYFRELDAGRNSALAIETEALIGFVRYSLRSNERGRVARVGILIGDRRHWNQGYGAEAMEVLLEFLFSRNGVDVVELDTADFNHRAQKCFEKVGFSPCNGEAGNESWRPPGEVAPTRRIWMELGLERWRERFADYRPATTEECKR